MKTRSLPAVILLSAASLLLAGCTGSISLTVPASTIATKAEDAIEAQIDSRPSIDCGDDTAVKVQNTTTLDCTLTDPATDAEYDVAVSISDVEGNKYVVNADVAEEASTPPEGDSDGASEVEGEDALKVENGAPLAYAYELAATAAKALEEQLGAVPTIVCEDFGKMPLTVGYTQDCAITSSITSAQGIATITVTAIDGLDYSISVTTKFA